MCKSTLPLGFSDLSIGHRDPTLGDRLKGKVVIVGIGNRLRGDDAAGPELIQRLKNSQLSILNPKLSLIDVGEVPENFLQKIAKFEPDVILLIDAVNFQSSPGSIEFIELNDIGTHGFSTHNLSLKLTVMYLKEETKADVFILGIQPKNLKMNSELSNPVKQAINQIKRKLIKCMKSI